MYFGLIYRATNLTNGKAYVGKTRKTLEYRWKRHLGQPLHVFGKALAKYGPEAFQLEVIEVIAANTPEYLQELLNRSERKFIANFNTKVPNGYNLTDGGEGGSGYKHTPEAHVKMHLAQLGNKKGVGRKKSPEEIEKMRQRWLGHKKSPETLEKMRLGMLGKPSARKGVKLSDETKEKIRQKRLGKHTSEETKAKLREAMKGNQFAKGTVWTDERRAEVSARFKGKPLSPEHRRKIKEANDRRFGR